MSDVSSSADGCCLRRLESLCHCRQSVTGILRAILANAPSTCIQYTLLSSHLALRLLACSLATTALADAEPLRPKPCLHALSASLCPSPCTLLSSMSIARYSCSLRRVTVPIGPCLHHACVTAIGHLPSGHGLSSTQLIHAARCAVLLAACRSWEPFLRRPKFRISHWPPMRSSCRRLPEKHTDLPYMQSSVKLCILVELIDRCCESFA
ncbi:hypothetical protein BCV70DRAFT_31232 [Testicularia cyperi]|uniref:Uncharacterized protein n=1 Tax=Testicularia cyperi TaxID=1882483 RepID=A0A317XJD8_9BASI|nr:hypothetical protein BCV70DRAFT_31232 [Testicularia cyperi]